jgi:hypothetical protein
MRFAFSIEPFEIYGVEKLPEINKEKFFVN